MISFFPSDKWLKTISVKAPIWACKAFSFDSSPISILLNNSNSLSIGTPCNYNFKYKQQNDLSLLKLEGIF